MQSFSVISALLPVLWRVEYLNGDSITGWKKQFPLRGNIRETTWKPQVYNKFPWGFHPGNYLIPCGFPRGGNTLRSGLHASIAWKLGSTSGFPIWKIGGNYMETPGFQRETWGKPQGNPGFPNVNIRETIWKPHDSPCKHKGNHMETSSFLK